jgi:hypothetical protein
MIQGTLAFEYNDGSTGAPQPFTASLAANILTLDFKDGSTGIAAVGKDGRSLRR